MKNSFLISLFFTLSPLCAFAQAGALDRALQRTEPVLAAEFAKAAGDMPVFTVPAPVALSIGDERYSDTPAAEYLPLNKRAVLEYEFTSSEFTAAKAVRVEVMNYSAADKTAQVNMVIFNKTKPKVSNYVLTAAQDGIRSTDSPLAGPRLEIPMPLAYNQVWNEGYDRHRVAALNAKVTVPAGVYNGCLKIVTKLGGGDAGTAERYYAPGVGLVYERITAEDGQQTLKLVSYQLK